MSRSHDKTNIIREPIWFLKKYGKYKINISVKDNQIIQKVIRKDKHILIALVDIRKSFDNVNWVLMFNKMRKAWILHAVRKILHNLYKDEVTLIILQNNFKKSKINEGVRQGFTLSTIIINAYIQES